MVSSYFQELSPPQRPLCVIGEGGWGERKRNSAVRLQNSRFFSPKSVKKSVKRGVRVLRARSAGAFHAFFDCSR